MTFNIKNEEERLKEKNKFDGNLILGARKFHESTSRTGQNKPLSDTLIPAHAKVVKDTGKDRYQRLEPYWERVDCCPVCQCQESVFKFSRMALDIFQCSHCTHQFMNPRITYEKIIELYEDDRTAQKVSTSATQKKIDRVKYAYGLSLIDQLHPPEKNTIVDLGCGVGVMMEEADKMGWSHCIGVDVNPNYQGTFDASRKGIQFLNANFDQLPPLMLDHSCDCITMWNVLEHVYDLTSMMNRLKLLLKPNGLLLILVPNVESLALRLFRSQGSTFSWPHVSHFCAKSLQYLMDHNGFVQEHLETVITEIDNIKSYMSGESAYSGIGDPEGLFDFITPDYLHQHMLGSRLLGIFRNR